MFFKFMRKDRGRILRLKRLDLLFFRESILIIRSRFVSIFVIYDKKEIVKEVLFSFVVECLRAVFVVFLWYEGIVYDVMVCVLFLKFYLDL